MLIQICLTGHQQASTGQLHPEIPYFNYLPQRRLQPGLCASAPKRSIPVSGCEPAIPSFLLPQPRFQTGACPSSLGHRASRSSYSERLSRRGPWWQPSYLSRRVYPDQRRKGSTSTCPVVTSKSTCNQQQQQQQLQQQCALQPRPAPPRARTPGLPSSIVSCQHHVSTSATAKWAAGNLEIPE